MESYQYLVAAYAVFWAISFVLVLSQVWRQRRLEAELKALRGVIEDGTGPDR